MTAPKGRGWLNDAFEAAIARRRIVTRAPWSIPPGPAPEPEAVETAPVTDATGAGIGGGAPVAIPAGENWADAIRAAAAGSGSIRG